MAKQVKPQPQAEGNQEVQEVLSASGQWIIKNQNAIMWCLIGVIAVILAVMAFNNYYLKPKAEQASEEIGKAVVYFAAGDYEKALHGDDADCIGFEAVADEYGVTQSGKLGALYAGLCYYNLEDYEQAIHFLKKFKADDLVIYPAALQKIGDSYAQLGDTEEAIKYFEKAAATGSEVIAPIALKKAGVAYMSLDNNKAAHKAFKAIKEKYPQSSEASDVDKYISVTE